MPKATVQEEGVPVEEPSESPPEEEEDTAVPETPQAEAVAVKPKPKPRAKASTRKDAPAPTKKKEGLDLKQKHQCGRCGKTMSLHTALYGHKNCPGEVTIPQPPALLRQVTVQEEAPEPEPQISHAQLLRMQLAQAAQERRAQAQLRVTAPIRQFYGL